MHALFENVAFRIIMDAEDSHVSLSVADMRKLLDAQAAIKLIAENTSLAYNLDLAFEKSKIDHMPGQDPDKMISVTVELYARLKTMEEAIEHIRKYPHDGLKLDDGSYSDIVQAANDGITQAINLRMSMQ